MDSWLHIYFTLPEPQGKTLSQLEYIYAKKMKGGHHNIEKNKKRDRREFKET